MPPLISVNLPTFNRARFIAQAIDSVLQQTFADWELNIVDNCSTDGTWEIISSYKDSRIRAYRNEENKGMVFSWNRLVQLSRGQYVCYLASDDWFAPNRLEKLLKYLTDNPECWGVCDYLIEVDEYGNRAAHGFFEKYFNRDIYGGDPHHALINCINAEAIGLFKRAYFDEVGEFEEGVTFCDFRMHVRNLAKRLRIGSLPERLHFKRQHSNSATANMKDGLTYECFYLYKYVFTELYLQDRNPTHLLVYIEWLLFERCYNNLPHSERRRLLDYVTGIDFPFDTFADFLSHVTQGIPAESVGNGEDRAKRTPPTEAVQGSRGHPEVVRDLVHVLVEKCLSYEKDCTWPGTASVPDSSETTDSHVNVYRREVVRLNREIERLKNLSPLRRLERTVRKVLKKTKAMRLGAAR